MTETFKKSVKALQAISSAVTIVLLVVAIATILFSERNRVARHEEAMAQMQTIQALQTAVIATRRHRND